MYLHENVHYVCICKYIYVLCIVDGCKMYIYMYAH